VRAKCSLTLRNMVHIVTIKLFKGYGAVVQLPPSECSGCLYSKWSGGGGGGGGGEFIFFFCNAPKNPVFLSKQFFFSLFFF